MDSIISSYEQRFKELQDDLKPILENLEYRSRLADGFSPKFQQLATYQGRRVWNEYKQGVDEQTPIIEDLHLLLTELVRCDCEEMVRVKLLKREIVQVIKTFRESLDLITYIDSCRICFSGRTLDAFIQDQLCTEKPSH